MDAEPSGMQMILPFFSRRGKCRNFAALPFAVGRVTIFFLLVTHVLCIRRGNRTGTRLDRLASGLKHVANWCTFAHEQIRFVA